MAIGYESVDKGTGTMLRKIGTMIPPPVQATSIETYLNVVPALSSNEPNTLHPIYHLKEKRKTTIKYQTLEP